LAARGLVPDRIMQKRKIGFLTSAVDSWVRSNLRGALSDYLLDPGARYADFLDGDRVARMVSGFPEEGGPRASRLLVILLMLEVWLSSYLPRALARRPRSSQPALT
jgi:hypothetical protein